MSFHQIIDFRSGEAAVSPQGDLQYKEAADNIFDGTVALSFKV